MDMEKYLAENYKEELKELLNIEIKKPVKRFFKELEKEKENHDK